MVAQQLPALAADAGKPEVAGPYRHGLLPWLVALLAFAPIAIMRAGLLTEPDTFWEIRTGLITMTRHAIPAADPFSWTMHGRPWMLNSWGFNVLIGAAYRLAGLPGVAWACAGFAMLAAGLVLVLARQLGAPPFTAGVVLLTGSPLLIGWLAARPQLVDYVAVLALVILLRPVAAGEGRSWHLAAAGLLSFVWVNLHAATLFGCAIAAGVAAVLVVRPGTRRSGWWCAAAAAAALAGSFANPHGAGLIGQTIRVQRESTAAIVEWSHFNPASPLQCVMLATGLAALVVAIRWRDVVLGVAIGLAVAGALDAERILPILVMLALPVLAAALGRSASVQRYIRSRRKVLIPGALAGMIVLTALGAASLRHIGEPDPAVYPVSLVRDIPAGCRLINTYVVGGLVILERPGVLVSVDSRNDLYGTRRIIADQNVIAGHGNLARGLAGAGCVLVPPDSGLARRLHMADGWKLRASSAIAVLFVRS